MSDELTDAEIAAFVATYKERYKMNFTERLVQLCREYPNQDNLSWEGQNIGKPVDILQAIWEHKHG